jgi:chromosome segregation ATPase
MEEDDQEVIDEAEEEEVSKKHSNDKSSGDETELVREAVLDLDRELARIRKEKNALNAQIKKIDYIVKNAEEVGKKVERLRYMRRVAKLDAQETELIQRKKKLQQKYETLSKRMSKVKGIKEKLSGV